MCVNVGAYEVADCRVVYDQTVMQLAGGVCVCANGDWIVHYNRLTDATLGNEAHFLRSGDNGMTWESTCLPLASRHEEGSVHVATGMIALDDGRVLMPFADYRSGRTSPQDHPRNLKLLRRPTTLHVAVSGDNVHHWDEIVDIDLPFDFIYPYGKIFRALDGALCLPTLVSVESGREYCRENSISGFVVSRDEGRSWGDWHEIVSTPNTHECVETSITRCGDGSLLALHRNSSPTLLASRSTDDGETWSDVEPTGLHGECGCVIQDSRGRLVAAYRSNRNSPSSVPMGLIVTCSEDHGLTWTPEAVLPDPKGRTYEAFHETGMPDIIVLPDGEIAIVYYSSDPNLPHCHPANDTQWDSLSYFWKRYIAVAILKEM